VLFGFDWANVAVQEVAEPVATAVPLLFDG
jgi:hypothetical protein